MSRRQGTEGMFSRIDKWLAFLASVILVAFACGCGSAPGGSASGKTNVEIVIASRQTASSPAGMRSILPRAIPDNVATVRVTVSAPDMTTIVQGVSVVPGDNSVSVILDIPNGPGRLFVVEVFNAVATLLYRGETPNVTLSGNPADGSPVSIDVQLATVALTFSQADLAGTWDYVFFDIGSYPGWERGTATIDGSGNVTVASILRSDGSTNMTAGSIIETISSTGVVSESGSGGNATFHGQMSSNKRLVIGTEYDSADNTATLRVFRKRTGTTFTSLDLASKSFTFHGLRSGTDNNWNYGAGTTDASGAVTLTSEFGPAGPDPDIPRSSGILSVSSAGIVSVSDDNTWYGLMTDDKTVIFKIDGNGGNSSYGFHVITTTGQTYTQSDYAGIYNWSVIRNGAPNPGWAYGVSSVNAAGTGTYLSYTDSIGGATPGDYTRVLSASGVITDPADPTAHGQMSYNKDITVRTNTNANGRYGLIIGFKQ